MTTVTTVEAVEKKGFCRVLLFYLPEPFSLTYIINIELTRPSPHPHHSVQPVQALSFPQVQAHSQVIYIPTHQNVLHLAPHSNPSPHHPSPPIHHIPHHLRPRPLESSTSLQARPRSPRRAPTPSKRPHIRIRFVLGEYRILEKSHSVGNYGVAVQGYGVEYFSTGGTGETYACYSGTGKFENYSGG